MQEMQSTPGQPGTAPAARFSATIFRPLSGGLGRARVVRRERVSAISGAKPPPDYPSAIRSKGLACGDFLPLPNTTTYKARAGLRAAAEGEDWTSALRTVARRSFVLEEAPNGFGRVKIVVQPSNQRLHQRHSWSQAGNALAAALYSVQHDRSTGGAGRPIRDSDTRCVVGVRARELIELDRLRTAIHFSQEADRCLGRERLAPGQRQFAGVGLDPVGRCSTR